MYNIASVEPALMIALGVVVIVSIGISAFCAFKSRK